MRLCTARRPTRRTVGSRSPAGRARRSALVLHRRRCTPPSPPTRRRRDTDGRPAADRRRAGSSSSRAAPPATASTARAAPATAPEPDRRRRRRRRLPGRHRPDAAGSSPARRPSARSRSVHRRSRSTQLAAYVASLGAGPAIPPDQSDLDRPRPTLADGRRAVPHQLRAVPQLRRRAAARSPTASTRRASRDASARAHLRGHAHRPAEHAGVLRQQLTPDGEAATSSPTCSTLQDPRRTPAASRSAGSARCPRALFVWLVGIGALVAVAVWIGARTIDQRPSSTDALAHEAPQRTRAMPASSRERPTTARSTGSRRGSRRRPGPAGRIEHRAATGRRPEGARSAPSAQVAAALRLSACSCAIGFVRRRLLRVRPDRRRPDRSRAIERVEPRRSGCASASALLCHRRRRRSTGPRS